MPYVEFNFDALMCCFQNSEDGQVTLVECAIFSADVVPFQTLSQC